MGYQKKKPKYKQPKQYHLVITDITNYIDKMVKINEILIGIVSMMKSKELSKY